MEFEERLVRLENDVYYGNGRGNPSLTIRMALMEDIMEKLTDNIKWLIRTTVASILTAAASIAVAVVLILMELKK